MAASSLPSIYEIRSLSHLNSEHFGPILHVVRLQAGDLDKVVERDQFHAATA